MRFALGEEHGQMYTSISAMLIESAALYSAWGLIYLVTYARHDTFSTLLLPGLGQVQVSISPWNEFQPILTASCRELRHYS